MSQSTLEIIKAMTSKIKSATTAATKAIKKNEKGEDAETDTDEVTHDTVPDADKETATDKVNEGKNTPFSQGKISRLAVGDNIIWSIDKYDTAKGTITSIKDEYVTAIDTDGRNWTIDKRTILKKETATDKVVKEETDEMDLNDEEKTEDKTEDKK